LSSGWHSTMDQAGLRRHRLRRASNTQLNPSLYIVTWLLHARCCKVSFTSELSKLVHLLSASNWHQSRKTAFGLVLLTRFIPALKGCSSHALCYLQLVLVIVNMDDSRAVNETTALLPSENRTRISHPLPWLQISIVLFLQICEPITSQSIYPYINQVRIFECSNSIVISSGSADQWIGHYRRWWAEGGILCWIDCKRRLALTPYLLIGSDLQESLFFATEAITVLHWSRASDYVGRKPILLIGLFGTSLSMLCFGLSRTFLGLVLR